MSVQALDRDPPQGRDEWRLRVEVRDGQWWEEENNLSPTLPNLSSPTHHHRQASWGHREPGGNLRTGQRRGSVRVAMLAKTGYKSRISDRHALLSNPANNRAARHVSPALYSPGTMQTAESTTHQPGLENYGKNRLVAPRLFDKDNKEKDPFISAKVTDGRGTVSGNFIKTQTPSYQSRNFLRVRRLRREMRDHLQQRLGVSNEDEVKVSFLGREFGTLFEIKQHPEDSYKATSDHHHDAEPFFDHTGEKRDRTSVSQIHITRASQGMAGESSRKQRNSKKSRGGHKEAKLSLLPSGKNETYTDRQNHPTGEGIYTLLLQDMDVSESFRASPHLKSTSQRRKNYGVKRDVSEAVYGELENIPTEERGCDETVFDYRDGDDDSGWRVHVVETVVTVKVKDINDNAPVFPDTIILGAVDENGAQGELRNSLSQIT